MLSGTSGRVVGRRFLTDATNDSLPLTKFEIQIGYSYLGAGSWIDRAPTENIVEEKKCNYMARRSIGVATCEGGVRGFPIPLA